MERDRIKLSTETKQSTRFSHRETSITKIIVDDDDKPQAISETAGGNKSSTETRRLARFSRRESDKDENVAEGPDTEVGDETDQVQAGTSKHDEWPEIDIAFPNKYASMCSEPCLLSSSYQSNDSKGASRSPKESALIGSDSIVPHFKPAPFAMRWIHGYNQKVPVINLNSRGSTILFYAAVNCGVLYNWTSNTMKILQGHKHMVTCLASDADGNWLVTADSGPENIITIWDTVDYFPHKTLFSPHGNIKVSKLALSADAKYLLTLGYHEKAALYWWIWSYGLDTPHAVTEVDIPQNSVMAMAFHPEKSTQFVLMTKQDIWIGTAAKTQPDERGLIKEDEYKLKIRKPEKDISPEYGKLTCFCFVVDTSQIFVGSSRGAVLVYGYSLDYQEHAERTEIDKLKFVKVLTLEKYRINDIKSVDGIIVTGNHGGEIRFYDDHLMLLYWVHGFRPDSVKGLSFNPSPRSYQILDAKCNQRCPCWEKVEAEIDPITGGIRQKLIAMTLPVDCTTEHKPILVRDFVVSTQNQGIGFVDFVTEKMETIVNCKVSLATTMTVNPDLSLVCIGYADGVIELFNYAEHRVIVRRDLREHYKVVTPPNEHSINCATNVVIPQLAVACLKYSPSGLHLACGLNTGELIFLDPSMISILSPKPHSDTIHSIKEMAFSPDSMKIALTDSGRTICVYKYDCAISFWRFIGKHRSHYKDICSIFFSSQKNTNGEYKLFSLGHDRIMVEYDIGMSSEEYLEIYSLDRADQTAVPLAGILWPNMKGLDPQRYRDDIPMMLVANDEYKFKIINYETTMTLSTVLGPRYETPVCKVQLITRKENDEEQQYLLFATKNVIGLQKMPLDGNPWKHVGILGHPVQVTEMCFREDSGTLFTIGAKDSCMIQWGAKYKSVEWTTAMGGSDLDPYYSLIEDGRSGWLFQEIRDLFYYIQILCQGTFSPVVRHVKDYVPIDALPDLMRAVGYFPTEYEVENLIIEAKFKVYQRQPSKEVNFEEFVKLYLNHRPAFGDNFTKLRNAFRFFAVFRDEKYFMNREDFLEALNNHGECFPHEMSWYLLSILSGMTAEDRASMPNYDFSFLPKDISFQMFVNEIIGIQEIDTSEGHSMMESTGSQQTGSSYTDQSYSDRNKNIDI